MMHKLKEGTGMINLHLRSFFWVSAPGYGVVTPQKYYLALKGRLQVDCV